MAISWEQIEGGPELRGKILAYATPKYNHIEKMAPKNNQTIFTISYRPTIDLVKMYINGLVYYENTHFYVNRDNFAPKIIWSHTIPNGGFSLESTDKIFIDYWSLTRNEDVALADEDDNEDNKEP